MNSPYNEALGATLIERTKRERIVLVGVDGTLLTGQADAQQFTLHRQDDRATLNAAVLLRTGELAVASAAGLRVLVVPG